MPANIRKDVSGWADEWKLKLSAIRATLDTSMSPRRNDEEQLEGSNSPHYDTAGVGAAFAKLATLSPPVIPPPSYDLASQSSPGPYPSPPMRSRSPPLRSTSGSLISSPPNHSSPAASPTKFTHRPASPLALHSTFRTSTSTYPSPSAPSPRTRTVVPPHLIPAIAALREVEVTERALLREEEADARASFPPMIHFFETLPHAIILQISAHECAARLTLEAAEDAARGCVESVWKVSRDVRAAREAERKQDASPISKWLSTTLALSPTTRSAPVRQGPLALRLAQCEAEARDATARWEKGETWESEALRRGDEAPCGGHVERERANAVVGVGPARVPVGATWTTSTLHTLQEARHGDGSRDGSVGLGGGVGVGAVAASRIERWRGRGRLHPTSGRGGHARDGESARNVSVPGVPRPQPHLSRSVSAGAASGGGGKGIGGGSGGAAGWRDALTSSPPPFGVPHPHEGLTGPMYLSDRLKQAIEAEEEADGCGGGSAGPFQCPPFQFPATTQPNNTRGGGVSRRAHTSHGSWAAGAGGWSDARLQPSPQRSSAAIIRSTTTNLFRPTAPAVASGALIAYQNDPHTSMHGSPAYTTSPPPSSILANQYQNDPTSTTAATATATATDVHHPSAAADRYSAAALCSTFLATLEACRTSAGLPQTPDAATHEPTGHGDYYEGEAGQEGDPLRTTTPQLRSGRHPNSAARGAGDARGGRRGRGGIQTITIQEHVASKAPRPAAGRGASGGEFSPSQHPPFHPPSYCDALPPTAPTLTASTQRQAQRWGVAVDGEVERGGGGADVWAGWASIDHLPGGRGGRPQEASGGRGSRTAAASCFEQVGDGGGWGGGGGTGVRVGAVGVRPSRRGVGASRDREVDTTRRAASSHGTAALSSHALHRSDGIHSSARSIRSRPLDGGLHKAFAGAVVSQHIPGKPTKAEAVERAGGLPFWGHYSAHGANM